MNLKSSQQNKDKKISKIDILVPVYNEGPNVRELVERVDAAMGLNNLKYTLIFIDDKSTDNTVKKIKELSKDYPIRLLTKQGKKGKTFSILEGFEKTEEEYVAMIDGDLQYPPEAIPKMVKRAQKNPEVGIVVANRKTYDGELLRRLGSRINAFIFGHVLLGLNHDVQSGLKLIKRDVINYLDTSNMTQWTFDMPLLRTAKDLGYEVGEVDIIFSYREKGDSKISFIKTAVEIALGALKLKLRHRAYPIAPIHEKTMHGSGIHHKNKQYLTHSTIPYDDSAHKTFWHWQKAVVVIVVGVLIAGLIFNLKLTATVFMAVLTTIYFLDVLLTGYLVLKSLHFPPELSETQEKLDAIKNADLPIYTILCPLFKEAAVLPQFLNNIDQLDWPKHKLDVILLLEEVDEETINKAAELDLPKYVRTVIVPHSNPQTKPKACNYGLSLAKGEYVVIYDAEDDPDPMQLKKAYLGFNKIAPNVACLQAKLNYYNPHHNLLTRLFTAEYSLWFDLILPGFQTIETTIPLGGTSNHFRTHILKKLHGWDAFNVTEDCDLGARLFKKGYKTAIIDSVTLEEANSNLGNWIRQRSRWIKGYMQTYLVHMRDPIGFAKEHGKHSALFNHVIGVRIIFMLVNPIMWVTTISYFVLYSYIGPAIEELFPPVIFYMGVTSLVFGNFLHLYNYMIGTAKRGHWSLMKYIFLMPFYWFLISVSAVKAFYQLIFNPHFWEKTHHGLHLTKRKKGVAQKLKVPSISVPTLTTIKFPKLETSPVLWSGTMLIASSLISNFANFIYNAYLGREVDLIQFGTISLISNIFAISAVFSVSLGRSTAHKTAYLLGKLNILNKDFYRKIRRPAWIFSLSTTVIWLLLTPLLASFFNESDITPFLLFTPYWMISFVGAANHGFLSGSQKFSVLGVSILVESLSKVIFAILAVEAGHTQLVYAVIPSAVFLSFLFEAFIVHRIKSTPAEVEVDLSFPIGYYLTSILTKVSTVVFLSADVILAKHFLSPLDAGRYALLSLSGKIIYFLGNLSNQFIIPLISREEGRNRDSKKTFYALLGGSTFLSLCGIVVIGILGHITIPMMFGDKAVSIIEFLPRYTVAMFAFSISSAIVAYHQIKKRYSFAVVPLMFAALEVLFISLASPNITSFVGIIATLSYIQLVVIGILHAFYPTLESAAGNLAGFVDDNILGKPVIPGKKRVLVFNWRDTKHVWAGGAEVYVHELAKRWVANGHDVTVFCGNDKKCVQNETIDGVNVIRKGGFYTVYLWAAIYYIFKLRKNCDVVVDSENGIPFFTPLFVRKPIVLLIHHVHKDVVLNELKLPKYLIPAAFVARTLETWLMPLIYKKSKVVAVSKSTKADLKSIGFDKEISIVNPGVEKNKFKRARKSNVPSILYLGRIKFYKSIDTLIRAHKLVVDKVPNAKLLIAGFGDAREYLEELTNKMNLGDKVSFLGKVSEAEKVRLMGRSWVFAYPSTMEGWGISIIEASASETAVVASDVPGLRDSVKNPSSGLLVEKGNPEEFAKAIIKLISDEKLRGNFEKEGKKWAENFTWDNSAEKFINIIGVNNGEGTDKNNKITQKGRS